MGTYTEKGTFTPLLTGPGDWMTSGDRLQSPYAFVRVEERECRMSRSLLEDLGEIPVVEPSLVT